MRRNVFEKAEADVLKNRGARLQTICLEVLNVEIVVHLERLAKEHDELKEIGKLPCVSDLLEQRRGLRGGRIFGLGL